MDQPAATYVTQPLDVEHAIHGAGIAAAWARATAGRHSIRSQTEPVDTFADAISRLWDAEVDLDPIERLLLAIERAGIVDGAKACCC
jgi:hypothetical protein